MFYADITLPKFIRARVIFREKFQYALIDAVYESLVKCNPNQGRQDAFCDRRNMDRIIGAITVIIMFVGQISMVYNNQSA